MPVAFLYDQGIRAFSDTRGGEPISSQASSRDDAFVGAPKGATGAEVWQEASETVDKRLEEIRTLSERRLKPNNLTHNKNTYSARHGASRTFRPSRSSGDMQKTTDVLQKNAEEIEIQAYRTRQYRRVKNKERKPVSTTYRHPSFAGHSSGKVFAKSIRPWSEPMSYITP